MLTRQRAKASLKKKGWSYRRAALFLDISFVHLAKVLTGTRESARLLARIQDMPKSPVPYQNSGFARRKAA